MGIPPQSYLVHRHHRETRCAPREDKPQVALALQPGRTCTPTWPPCSRGLPRRQPRHGQTSSPTSWSCSAYSHNKTRRSTNSSRTTQPLLLLQHHRLKLLLLLPSPCLLLLPGAATVATITPLL